MNRRLLLAVSASALILAGTIPATTLAAGPSGPSRRIDISKIDPSFRPMLAQKDRAVSVVLQLSGAAAIQPGLSRAAQVSRASGLATTQKSVAAAVAKAGGKVVARYQYTYNGLRVRTTVDKLAALSAIRGVVAIRPVRVYERTNAIGVPAIGAPTAWADTGATGAGVVIAVVDTGIDYTHANFGGAGTETAYTSNNPTAVEPGSFPTPKVIAGYDFAGNDYDANGDLGNVDPAPDADPLDCGGHGSHVAGTAAGMGVNADHSTYRGTYTAGTIGDGSAFAVAPGVAPEAKLVALKVFGCEGSTDLVVEALEWVGAYNASHVVGIDIVNMSLGSLFGSNTDPDAVATNALVGSGVVVVASAGNSGSIPYIAGAPAAATKAISVAALDATPTIPMATVDFASSPDIAGINMNAYPGLPVSGVLDAIGDGGTGLLEGCSAGDYAGVTGKIVAIRRGTCAFVDKGAAAEAAGAIGVIVVNRDGTDVADDELPAFLGYNPETFSIPMIGVARNKLAAVIAGDGTSVNLVSSGAQANPTYGQVASFSSSGPGWGDSALRPDVSAPGVSILSTLSGSGWKGTTYSGTSMAAPMTTGAAALVIQGHPAWSPLRVKAALSNTASAASIVGYTPLRAGSGFIRADIAVKSNVTATTSDGTASLSYGYIQATGAWSATKTITITNDGNSRAVYSLASSSGTVKLSASAVSIAAHSSATIKATAAIGATPVKNLCSADPMTSAGCVGLYSRSGAVTATPLNARTGQYALRVPFLVVPRGASSVVTTRSKTWTKSAGKVSGKLIETNASVHAGNADVYALGITDSAGDAKLGTVVTRTQGTDIRAAGVQVLPASVLDDTLPATDRALMFAVNMHDRFSSIAPHEVDVLIDTNADGEPDYDVFGYDYGLATAGVVSGMWVSFVVDLSMGPNGTIIDAWEADAPLNGSTVLLPATASDLGLAAGSGAFRYQVQSFDGLTGAMDATASAPVFDAYAPKQSTGQFKAIAGRSTGKISAWFYRGTVRGWLVVTMDDRNGAAQADIVKISSKP